MSKSSSDKDNWTPEDEKQILSAIEGWLEKEVRPVVKNMIMRMSIRSSW